MALALIFSTVILLIADLDRANEAALLVDQAPVKSLSLQLKALQEREEPAPAVP